MFYKMISTEDYLEPNYKEQISELVESALETRYDIYLGMECNGFMFVVTDQPSWEWEVDSLYSPEYDEPVLKERLVEKLVQLSKKLEEKCFVNLQGLQRHIQSECDSVMEDDNV